MLSKLNEEILTRIGINLVGDQLKILSLKESLSSNQKQPEGTFFPSLQNNDANKTNSNSTKSSSTIPVSIPSKNNNNDDTSKQDNLKNSGFSKGVIRSSGSLQDFNVNSFSPSDLNSSSSPPEEGSSSRGGNKRSLRKGFGFHRKGKALRPQLIVAEPSIPFCEALWQYFYNLDGVKVMAMSFNQIQPIDFNALVITGNCLGIPEQTKIWTDLKRFDLFFLERREKDLYIYFNRLFSLLLVFLEKKLKILFVII